MKGLDSGSTKKPPRFGSFLVPRRGIGHRYFSAEKSVYPGSPPVAVPPFDSQANIQKERNPLDFVLFGTA